MNENQKAQRETAVREAHEKSCDAAGCATSGDMMMRGHMSHEAHMMSHRSQKGYEAEEKMEHGEQLK